MNKCLLVGNKFMPKMHLKQPGLTSSACRSFTKNKERIQKFKETWNGSYIYKNELVKDCFQHDMACGDFKEHYQIKFCEIKHLVLLKIVNMMDIKED